MKKFFNFIISLHPNLKKTITIIFDIILCFVCTWLSLLLKLDELITFQDFNYNLAFTSVIIAIPVFWLFGLYNTILRYADRSILSIITSSIFTYAILFFITTYISNIQGVPKAISVLQPILLYLGIIASRLGVKYLLTNRNNFKKITEKQNVLVYGAGSAGSQLVDALKTNQKFDIKGFIDDNPQLHNRILSKVKVYDPSNLDILIQTKSIQIVLIAIPSINRKRKNEIIENLRQYKLIVKTLPSIGEILGGNVRISHIKDLNIDELLIRDEIKPKTNLLNQNIVGKTVFVTGAGGSIGSELCRQIINLKPKKLLLLEFNEFSLYKIYEELESINHKSKVIPLLINAQNQKKIEIILETFKVDTVYHAAAYKHVPLVEENICEAIKNNVFSTLAVVKASVNKKVSSLVLVSSDKAVRPTNIMGASKRLSELCMQGICNSKKNIWTKFSIVRFGNVLESSGSVIPKFKTQIKDGGPITLTHKDITRYFMTVTEASQLVIQAGAMGKKAEVFILDMGERVKIMDLIHNMVKLSGLSIKDDDNLDGDIEIKIIGLRPGEKLHEELLIGDNPQKTSHLKVKKITENYIPLYQLELYLNKLEIFIENNEVKKIKDLFQNSLKIYNSNHKIVDHLYLQSLSRE